MASNMALPQDHPIIATAEDAVTTKYAAIETGYYQDPFVEPFYAAQRHPPRRPVQVIIKRGTFARVACVSKTIASFLKLAGSSEAQVVVLGAGKDTSFFRWIHKDSGEDDTSAVAPVVRWVEVDHPSVIQEKISVIRTQKEVFGVSVEGDSGDATFSLKPLDSSTRASCRLISRDLREDPTVLCDVLQEKGIKKQVPTLFVSECVFMYMPQMAVQNLLACIRQAFPQSCLCLYEPILGADAFGSMMQDNLTRAGVARPNSCLLQTRSLGDYASMMGFQQTVGCEMYAAYETILSAEQRRTASQCEFLDELEEFMLIMRHYCFVIACTAESTAGKELCQVGKHSVMGFKEGKCIEFKT